MVATRKRTLALCIVATLASACAFDLPEEALIVDERVLGVRPVAPDGDEEVPRAEFLPLQDVTIEVLAVDAEGPLDPASVQARWLACPSGPNLPTFSCVSDVVPVDLADVPQCPTDAGTPVDLPAPCVLSDAFAPSFVVPAFTQAFAGFSFDLTLILALGDGPDIDGCSEALLAGDYDTPDGCLYTGYAMAIGPASELAALNPNAPPTMAPDDSPNHHPSPARVMVGLDDGDAFEVMASGASVTLQPGQMLRLDVEPNEADLETYSVPVNNGESFTRVQESLTTRWFRSSGTFEGSGQAPPILGATGVVWAPGDKSTARIYALTRDGRGGVDWWWLDIEVAS